MSKKIGIFFLLIGLLGLILSYMTYQLGEFEWLLGFISLISAIGGFLILIKRRSPSAENGRFRSYRKYRARRDEQKKHDK